MQDKLQKARKIIAKLLASRIFTDWENRTMSDVISMLEKYNDEMGLGINPGAVFQTMLREEMIHNNGTYNDEPIFSTHKAKEKVSI